MKDTQVKAPVGVNEGWAIHIYDRDRHLLCSLEPSHGWVFCTGIGLGIVAAIIGSHLGRSVSPQVSAAPAPTAIAEPSTTPSPATPISPHSARESMFWID